MKVKEAIEIVRGIKHSGNGYGNAYIEDFDKCKEIIALLQQGRKCREMWEEATTNMTDKVYKASEYFLERHGLNLGYQQTAKIFEMYFNSVEQKYFPKEASQDYKEGEE